MPDATMALESPNYKPYGLAALWGLLYYGLFYFLWIQWLVLLKWDTTELEEFVKVEYYNPPLPQYQHESLQGLPTADEVEKLRYVAHIKQTSAMDFVVNDAYQKLDEHNDTLRNWEYWDDADTASNDNDIILTEGQKTIRLVSLAKLLQLESLSSLSTEHWNASIPMVLRELKGLANLKYTVQWHPIQTALSQQDLPAKEKLLSDDLYDSVCQLSLPLDNDEQEEGGEAIAADDNENDSSSAENVDLSLYVGEDDLESRWQKLLIILEARGNQQLKDYLKSTREEVVDRTLDDAVRVVQDDLDAKQALLEKNILAATTKTNQVPAGASQEQCVATNDIETLVTAGLEALHKRRDLRAALLQSLADLDPMLAKDMILDAVLETDAPLPLADLSYRLHLQRFLMDTPLSQCLQASMDQLFQSARRHTDRLDVWMESVIKNNDLLAAQKDAGATHGELTILYLIQVSEPWNVPVPGPLRQMLQRFDLGRNLLEIR